MKTIFVITLLLLTSGVFNAFSQDMMKVSGKVVDSETSTPLSYAHISLKGHSIGTVSNVEGEFEFHFDSHHIKDTLEIGYIGYENWETPIFSLDQKDLLSIKLMPATTVLSEVIVFSDKLTGKEIVHTALAKLGDNYPHETYLINGYFREIEKENGKYVLLSEAALSVYDKGFDKHKGWVREYINIDEVRKSLNYRTMSSRNDITFSLLDLFENNDIRYQRNIVDIDKTTYSLDSVTQYNNRPVFVISTSRWIDRGKLYIDMETFGIIKATMDRKVREEGVSRYYRSWNNDSITTGRVQFSYSVEFEEYQGKYYLSLLSEWEQNEIFDPNSGKVKTVHTEQLEFFKNNLKTVKVKIPKEIKRLSPKRRLRYGPYNPDFWENYNVIKATPLDKKLIEDLERDIPLDQQYESSSKN